jgi:hypothetical protein
MYPQSELNRLVVHKYALRLRIAAQRVDYAAAVARATQPLAWLDRVRNFFLRCAPLAPFAAVPLGLVVQRTFFPRLKFLGLALRWGPAAYAAFRRRRSGPVV